MGYRVAIDPEDIAFEVLEGESIVDAALRGEVEFPHGCRNGQCGGCKAEVAEGEWRYLNDYIPDILSRWEIDQGMVVTCKATPVEDLLVKFQQRRMKHYEKSVQSAVVEVIERLAEDVIRLVLRLPDGVEFGYHPGQYVDFLLENGQRRAFSLANRYSPAGRLEFHIRRVPGGYFTDRQLSSIKLGDVLHLEGPLGAFLLDGQSRRPVIFVAGGTGFAPIKVMLESVLENAADRQFHLYWGARASAGLYQDTWAHELAAQYPQLNYVPVLSSSDSGWQGRTGPVHQAVVEDHPDLSGFDIYMAGPPAMIDAGREVFPAFGHPEDQCFSDAFVVPGGEPVGKKGLSLGARLGRLFGRKNGLSP
ncbi:MAG: FAD-binding oxidoreductase [Chromatiales bacterium]|nr:FAD-binding oxidoreductase [Chromatiales bacterium]